MITIKFSEFETRSDAQITTQWLQESYKKRNKNGESICIQVIILEGDTDLVLSCGNCPRSNSSGEIKFNREEKKIINEWKNNGLNLQELNFGKLNSFIDYLLRMFDKK